MTEAAQQEAPPTSAAQKFQLAPPRKAPRTGMLKSGLAVFTGLAKSGKNTLALSRPGLSLIETEKMGSDHIDGWVQEVANLNQFREAFAALLKDPNCTAIGVSTSDKLIGWWQDEICALHGVKSMSVKIEGVNQWQELRQRVEVFIEKAKTCGKLIVVLAHYKEPKLDSDGKLVVQQNIDAPGKIGGLISAEADLIGACSKAKVGPKMQYKVSFSGGGQVGAFGGRVRELEGKDIILPEENQWAAVEAVVAEAIAAKAAATPPPAKEAPAKADAEAPKTDEAGKTAAPESQQVVKPAPKPREHKPRQTAAAGA